MKPTQEQVIAWARESLEECDGTDYYDYTDKLHWWGILESIEAFAALAYEAGRKDENEACAKMCEDYAKRFDDIRSAALEMAAENIRAKVWS